MLSITALADCYQLVDSKCKLLGQYTCKQIITDFIEKDYKYYALLGISKDFEKKKGLFKKSDKPEQTNLIRKIECKVWKAAMILDQMVLDPQYVKLDDEGLKKEAAKRAGIKPALLTTEVIGTHECFKTSR